MKSTMFARAAALARAAIMALAFVAAATGAIPAAAQQAGKFTLTDQDRADIARVEKYINGIRTMRSGFIQVAPNGAIAQGKLYISRPGKLRVEYDPPVQVLMVATGIWFIYYDAEINEATYLPLRATPIALLLKENVKLNRDAHVVGVDRQGGLLRISVTASDDKEGANGVLTLTFSERPLALRQWIVSDAQGNVTKLALLDPRFGVKIPPERFQFVNPSAPDESGENR